jgi:hypothetical protein
MKPEQASHARAFGEGAKRSPRGRVRSSDDEMDGSDRDSALTSELLVLPDGRILVHNLTPAFADLLNELNPADDAVKLRASKPRTTDRQPATARDELRPGT